MRTHSMENARLEKQLKTLSDRELLEKTFVLAKKEQQTTLSLLFHLKEVNERRSYALLGCSSLWEYTVKILGYGESGASERINTMRLLIQVPELKEKFETGKITLTTASQAQRFFQAERKVLKKNYSASQKLDILNQIEGFSKREVEQRLVALSPEQAKLPSRIEKTRALSESKTEIKFVADNETMGMIKRVREVKGSDFSFSQIFKLSVKAWLAQNDPEQKYSKKIKKNKLSLNRETCGIVESLASHTADATKNLARKTVRVGEPSATSSQALVEEKQNQKEAATVHQRNDFARKINNNSGIQTSHLAIKPQHLKKISRYIPIGVRRKIYARAKGQCEYKSPLNGMRCASKTKLQWDHIHPYALGGKNSEKNMALLCFSHNQRRAIEAFGRQKIEKLRSASGENIEKDWPVRALSFEL